MPNIKYLVESEYKPTFRTKKIEGMFDFHPEDKIKQEWDVDLPLSEKEWSIGLIIGASGSGKSTLAENVFKSELIGDYSYSRDKSFVDSFDSEVDTKEIVKVLTSVGFSSVPNWFVPYHVLSTGQKFRVDIARAVLENNYIVFDEFTSVVDRTVAMSASIALSKYIRKANKKFVAVTCHSDVEEYLQPDWVFNVSTNQFKWGCLRRRPVEANIRKASKEEWQIFRKHHYLNTSLSVSAQCFIAEINNQPVAFGSYIHFPHPTSKIIKKEHRTVVLPDFQGLGLGLGVRLSDFMAMYCRNDKFRFLSTTSHPTMIGYRTKSPLWKLTRSGRVSKSKTSIKGIVLSNSRNTCAFEYIG